MKLNLSYLDWDLIFFLNFNLNDNMSINDLILLEDLNFEI